MAFTARIVTKFIFAPERYEAISVHKFLLKSVKKYGKYVKKFRYALKYDC
jgi:hypothetical protein